MESEDQVEKQSTVEQPKDGSEKAAEHSQAVDIDGESISIDELKAGYLRQSDYTKKTQELSRIKKDSELSTEDQAAVDFIKKNGFVTQADLDSLSAKQAQDANLNDIIAANPDLKPFQAAIKELVNSKGIAPEDVIEKYGFKSKDKLAKARSQGDIKGAPEAKTKAIKDMTTAEYTKYKVKMGYTNDKGTFSS